VLSVYPDNVMPAQIYQLILIHSCLELSLFFLLFSLSRIKVKKNGFNIITLLGLIL